MTRPTVGVVGPGDLVEQIAPVTEQAGRCPVVRVPYQHENETSSLVRRHHDEVDCWLFTGIVPRTLAELARVVDHPAEHVCYSGVTLLSVVVRLLNEGLSVRSLSVDTLDTDDVRETLAAAGLGDTRIAVLAYRNGQTAERLIDFHRNARHRFGPDTVALTCLGSAFAVLSQETHAVRMVPSRKDTRHAVGSLLLKTQSHRYSDAQVAVGFARLQDPGSTLARLLGELGASTTALADGRLAFVTTRGPLWAVTRGFTGLPMLTELAGHLTEVHIGIGIGRTAAEGEALANTAFGRAREAGGFIAALALPNEAPRVLETGAEDAAPGTAPDLQQLASRAGVSKNTLLTIRSLLDTRGGRGLTAQDVATAFGVHERTARRMVKQLERAGIAVVSGRRINGPGRPLMVYDLRL
ncbi:HTH domain-containing protein [Amycolatopsis cihanbeyliensis]|uniref:HTH domain-containing protein n=1 Tax=Amycolatopsis cihanbeyliensis TaxID=1128664 RepID=A0A542DR71_AMYCI|nr:HTH domain-containing protein [Amycolatopsis cihanbeyliensis]TQJ05602.1 HTH domain-containing protein [Amycolatopsis cihanbeyliensis]